MKSRALWAGWTAAGLSLVVLTLSLLVRAGEGVGVADLVPDVITSLGFLMFPVVGAVIVMRRRRHPVGWLFLIGGLGWAIAQLGKSYGDHVLAGGEPLPLEEPMIWIPSWIDSLGFITTGVLVALVFPTGRLLSQRWRSWVWFAIGGGLVGSIGAAFSPGPLEDAPRLQNPYGVSGGLGTVFEVFAGIGWPLMLIPLGAAVVALITRFKRASGDERQQVKWMLYAGMLLCAFVVFWMVSVMIGREGMAESLQGVGLGAVPVAAGIAILKYRLYDIDVVINRTLVYATLTGLLATFYIVAVGTLQLLLDPLTNDSELAVAAATLAIAALFRPVRTRVQSFVDKRFYRSRYDATQTLSSFATHLRNEVDLGRLQLEVTRVVQDTMSPRHVSLWLRDRA